MQGEYLFRALKADGSNEWVYGYYVSDPETTLIPHVIYSGRKFVKVIPETVGQFTGLTDKNGTRIFEGDKFNHEDDEFAVVEWIKESACFGVSVYGYAITYGEGSQEVIDNKLTCVDRNCYGIEDMKEDEVIGNIHQQ